MSGRNALFSNRIVRLKSSIQQTPDERLIAMLADIDTYNRKQILSEHRLLFAALRANERRKEKHK